MTGRERREEHELHGFEPHLIRQRNEEMLREVHSLRLKEQLRTNREPRAARFVALARRGVLPLLRRTVLVQR